MCILTDITPSLQDIVLSYVTTASTVQTPVKLSATCRNKTRINWLRFYGDVRLF